MNVCVYHDDVLASYHFGKAHPFGPQRLGSFWQECVARGLDKHIEHGHSIMCSEAELSRFHTAEYIERVKLQSQLGQGYLDFGDTPAYPGIFEAASYIVGSVLDAAQRILQGQSQRCFIPIAGLHHARRDAAAGFCVFNDIGVLVETLRQQHNVQRIAYVDIDAHHGDGVFYSFEHDPDLIIADMHEDGRYLYPGTGASHETGLDKAAGSKLNIPMPPASDDQSFFQAWEQIEHFVRQGKPEMIILQAGADSLAGDPITHLHYSDKAHGHAADRLCKLADEFCQGRLIALGGGGYNLNNLALAWNAVVAAMLDN